MTLLTNAVQLSSTAWSDLGVGPLTVTAHGPEWADVVLAVSDSQPPSAWVEGEPLRGSRFFSSTTHVWALALGQSARVVITAPDQGSGGANSTTANPLPVQEEPFATLHNKTVALTVGSSVTATPVALPAMTATSYRVRNAANATAAATWILSANTTDTPIIPVPYGTNGTGGATGDKSIDPGGVEIIGLTTAQQTALAAGTLYLSALCPAGGSAILSVTPGNGG